MTKSIVFYHAGCPVCVDAENAVLDIIAGEHSVEVVHLGQQPERVAQAEADGVKSVPALVVDGVVLHINHGADLSVLKG